MLIEIMGLGMPVAAAFGWWVGQKSPADKPKAVALRYSLNKSFLNATQDNRSCSIVEEIYRMNPSSTDLCFALAALYREKGDFTRAVELHQSILEKKQLKTELYARVSIELARDYLSAGFLDRAEDRLRRLVNKQLLMRESLGLLLEIYEQTKEWHKAIIIAKRLRYQGEKCDYLIAQYCCELAQQSLAANQVFDALKSYQHACLIDPNCARANIGVAKFHQECKEYVRAICHYRVVYDHHPELLSLIIEPMYDCYKVIDRADELIDLVRSNGYYRGFISAIMLIAKHLHKQESEAAALAFLHDELRSSSSLRMLHLAIMWSIHSNRNQGPSLRLWQEVLERNFRRSKDFSCRACGHTFDEMHWHCSACGEWAQVVPLLDHTRIHRHQRARELADFSI